VAVAFGAAAWQALAIKTIRIATVRSFFMKIPRGYLTQRSAQAVNFIGNERVQIVLHLAKFGKYLKNGLI
jgi:hypothetical protein